MSAAGKQAADIRAVNKQAAGKQAVLPEQAAGEPSAVPLQAAGEHTELLLREQVPAQERVQVPEQELQVLQERVQVQVLQQALQKPVQVFRS